MTGVCCSALVTVQGVIAPGLWCHPQYLHALHVGSYPHTLEILTNQNKVLTNQNKVLTNQNTVLTNQNTEVLTNQNAAFFLTTNQNTVFFLSSNVNTSRPADPPIVSPCPPSSFLSILLPPPLLSRARAGLPRLKELRLPASGPQVAAIERRSVVSAASVWSLKKLTNQKIVVIVLTKKKTLTNQRESICILDQ